MIVRVKKGSTTNEWRHVERVEVDYTYPCIYIHTKEGEVYYRSIKKGESVYIIDEKAEGSV